MTKTTASKKQNSSISKPRSKTVPNKMLDQMIEDNLAVPFETEILGIRVTVDRIDMTDDEQIVAVCSRRKSHQRVPILGLPLPDPPPKGAEWIAAYRRWARGK
jgi:hypothetical protein